MDEHLIALGISLTEVVSRNTISYVGNKVQIAKEKRDIETQSLAYSEIINNLLQDKEDLALIARQYKQAYEQVTISDDDIEYLHNTLRGAIEVMNAFSPQNVKNSYKM